MKKPTRLQVTLYSSALLLVLSAIAVKLQVMANDPSKIDVQELQDIQQQLQAIQAEKSTAAMTVMAWWYPGAPACNAAAEAAQYGLDVVKPEYFIVASGGQLELMTEAVYGCNGYSAENVARVKQLAPRQFVTVSASYAKDMDSFLVHDEQTGEYTKELVDFVTRHDLTGIEIDFEDFGGWSAANYARYKAFLTRLGNALHARDKALMIDLPPVKNTTEEQWYQLRLNELERLPVDYLVIMTYDYQYDYGAGQPITPLDWLGEVIDFTKMRVSDDSKIVIGLPSYGYIVDHTVRNIQILTGEQAEEYAIYRTAERDPNSQELIARGGKKTLVYQDSISLQAKLDLVEQKGIKHVSVWHLGGNPWF